MAVSSAHLCRLLETLRDAQNHATNGVAVLTEALSSTDPEFISLARSIRSVGAAGRLEPHTALGEATKALQTLKADCGVPHLWFRQAALMSQAAAYCQLDRFDEALDALSVCLIIAEELDSVDLIERVNISIGEAHRCAGDPASALRYLLRALKQPGLSADALASCHSSCANVYQDHAYWEREIEHRYLAVEAVSPAHGLPTRAALISSLVDRGKLDQALSLLNQLDPKTSAESDDFFKSHVLVATAQYLVAEGRLEESTLRLSEASVLARSVEPRRIHLLISMGTARLALADGRPAAALERLTPWLESEPFLADRRSLLTLLIEAERAQQNWHSLVRYQKLLLGSVINKQVTLHTLTELSDEIDASERAARKHQMLQLHAAELQGLKEDRDELIEIVANDLQTPLTTLKLATGMLSDKSSSPSVQRCLAWTESAVSRICTIATKLELVAELESGNRPTQLQEIALNSTVAGEVENLRKAAVSKSVALTCVLPAERFRAEVDCADLSLILSSLIENSLTFCDPGGHVEVHLDRSPRKTLIIVSDDGPGWAADEAKHLFKKHSRLSARPTGAEANSGLGLYLAQQLASQMNAVITASSPGLDRGACFTLVLPRLATD